MKINRWVEFWFKGEIKYPKNSKKATRNKSQRPKETLNPSGIIGLAQLFLTEGIEILNKLEVRESSREQTYLAAFLAC